MLKPTFRHWHTRQNVTFYRFRFSAGFLESLFPKRCTLRVKQKSHLPDREQLWKTASENLFSRFPSLVLPSSGSEGLLSAVPSRRVKTGCTPNGTIKIHGGKELLQYTSKRTSCQACDIQSHRTPCLPLIFCLFSAARKNAYLRITLSLLFSP